MARTIELYDMLRVKLGEAETKVLIETIEEAGKNAKVEYKDDLKAIRAEMSTKADAARLEGEIKTSKAELEGQLRSIRLEMKLYFLILLFVILFTNPKTMDLITRLFGIVK
jgi:hypothetical protein